MLELRWIGLIVIVGLVAGITGCPANTDLLNCCGAPVGTSTVSIDISSLTSTRTLDVSLPSRFALSGAGFDCVIWVIPADAAKASVEIEPSGVARVTGNYLAVYLSGDWPVIETTHTTAAASGLVGLVLPEPAEEGEYVYNAALLAANGELLVGQPSDQPIALGEFRLMKDQVAGAATPLSQVEPAGGTLSAQVSSVLAQVAALEADID